MLGGVKLPENADPGHHTLLFRDVFGWVLTESWRSALVSTVLVFVQALLINRLVDTFRMMNDRTWVPGAMFALAASALPDFLWVSPPLAAVTVVPLALGRMFGVYKQSMAFGPVFDSAFWLTVGSLFYPPLAWLLPVCFIGFFSLRSFHLREQIVFFTGVSVPFILALTFYFWYDAGQVFLSGQFSEGLRISMYSLPDDLFGALKTALLVVLLLTVLLGFNVYYYKKLIQVQKYITILYWFLFAGLIAALFHSGTQLRVFVLLMPSIAIFLAYSLQSLRNAFMAEVIHLGLLAVVFFIQFFPANS